MSSLGQLEEAPGDRRTENLLPGLFEEVAADGYASSVASPRLS